MAKETKTIFCVQNTLPTYLTLQYAFLFSLVKVIAEGRDPAMKADWFSSSFDYLHSIFMF